MSIETGVVLNFPTLRSFIQAPTPALQLGLQDLNVAVNFVPIVICIEFALSTMHTFKGMRRSSTASDLQMPSTPRSPRSSERPMSTATGISICLGTLAFIWVLIWAIANSSDMDRTLPTSKSKPQIRIAVLSCNRRTAHLICHIWICGELLIMSLICNVVDMV